MEISGRVTENLVLDTPGVVVDGREGAECWRCGVTIRADRVVLRNLTFRQSPRTAVVIENASEVRVENCRFLACGYDGGSVTLWLGNHTRGCVIEGCEFDLLGLRGRQQRKASHAHAIAVMTSETDCSEHLIAENTIAHYDYGIQLGCSGTCLDEGRHIVRGNRVLCPRTDGIHIKQARCLVEGNLVRGASNFSMSARAGFGTRFIGNTLEDGYIGLIVRGKEHEVRGNRFERIRAVALLLAAAKPNGDGFAAETTQVEGNQFVDCGGADAGRPVITYAGIDGEPYPFTDSILENAPTG
jgi:hypothetical protein